MPPFGSILVREAAPAPRWAPLGGAVTPLWVYTSEGGRSVSPLDPLFWGGVGAPLWVASVGASCDLAGEAVTSLWVN